MRYPQFVCLAFYFFMLAGFAPFANAASCEANFNTSGSKQTGLMFGTWIEARDLDPDDAIAQVRKLAESSGFEIGELTKDGRNASLFFSQKPTANARGFLVQATANVDVHSLNLVAILPSKMEAQPEDMRSAMCGMLAKVKLGQATKTDPLADRTAPPTKKLNVLQPKAIFDLGAAQAALEPGDSTITGTACVLRKVENGGGVYLATNQSVFLFPVTPYLDEAIQLSSKMKAGRDTLELSPIAMQVRLDGKTNGKGEFQFSKLKPGRYYLLTSMSVAVQGSSTKNMGTTFDGVEGRPTLTTHYQTEYFTKNFNDLLEKFVEIKNPGQTVKVTLTAKGFFNGRAGIFGCSG